MWYTRTFDVPVYASKNWTVDLQPLIDRDAKEVNVDDFWPAEVAQMKWKGHLYALPYDFSNMAIYYNKKMLINARSPTLPMTTGSGMKSSRPVSSSSRGRKPDQEHALNMGFGNWPSTGSCSVGAAKSGPTTSRPRLVNSKENLDCFKWFIDARKQGLYPERRHAAGRQRLRQSTAARPAGNGSWATVSLPRCDQGQVRLRRGRHAQVSTGAPCLNAASGAWGIAKNSKALEAAWTFNKFLTSTDSNHVLISDPLRSIPARKTAVPRWNETAAKGGMPPKNVAVFGKQMPDVGRAVSALSGDFQPPGTTRSCRS